MHAASVRKACPALSSSRTGPCFRPLRPLAPGAPLSHQARCVHVQDALLLLPMTLLGQVGCRGRPLPAPGTEPAATCRIRHWKCAAGGRRVETECWPQGPAPFHSCCRGALRRAPRFCARRPPWPKTDPLVAGSSVVAFDISIYRLHTRLPIYRNEPFPFSPSPFH